MRVSLWIVVSVLAAASGGAADPEIPHLRRQGTATQLVVDGQPFLIRGGELGNSTASNLDATCSRSGRGSPSST